MSYETDIFPSIDRIDNLIATPSEVRKKEIQNEGLRNAEQIIVEIATLKRRMIDFSCPSIVQGEYNIICREYSVANNQYPVIKYSFINSL